MGMAARAQTWPARQIQMILGFPPGPVDIVGRPVAARLQEALGQTVVFENRPGANGAIASEQVMRAAPDGYTILLATSGTHVTAVHLTKNLRYNPVTDFEPIIAAVEPVTCLVVHPSVPATTVQELIAWIKANPGKVSYGTSGAGSVFHLTGELFKQTTGVEMAHVPYRGLDPAMTDLIAGHIPVLFTALSTAAPQIDAGNARLIAMLEPDRFPRRPDTPSITEAIPAFRKPPTWFGFFAPKGTPAPVIAKLNMEIGKILAAPDMQARFQDAGYAMLGGTPRRLQDMMVDGIQRFGMIIKAAGIEPE
jgi:tripartite-type tricarboxylate transporter receptor subunit TctC